MLHGDMRSVSKGVSLLSLPTPFPLLIHFFDGAPSYTSLNVVRAMTRKLATFGNTSHTGWSTKEQHLFSGPFEGKGHSLFHILKHSLRNKYTHFSVHLGYPHSSLLVITT